ncbi:MAG: hypothetical protein HKM93_14125 [Desulfobacteraceae bacterium]|nr:hypothetical protein [Desulfobacteraceae bacterium]
MAKKKGKSVSFDAMVKHFMQHHKIPTTKDVDRLLKRIDRMEKTIRSLQLARRRSAPVRGGQKPQDVGVKSAATASDLVLETIGRFNNGAGIKEIQERTGFGDKKLRNIIYRLNSIGKIQRISRGKYTVTD